VMFKGEVAEPGFGKAGSYLRPGKPQGICESQGFAPSKLPRPESWSPYVFTSIDDLRLDEMLRQNRVCVGTRDVSTPSV
jgi:hypothetical protein